MKKGKRQNNLFRATKPVARQYFGSVLFPFFPPLSRRKASVTNKDRKKGSSFHIGLFKKRKDLKRANKMLLTAILVVCLLLVSENGATIDYARRNRKNQQNNVLEKDSAANKGPWIVHLSTSYSHDQVEQNIRRLEKDQSYLATPLPNGAYISHRSALIHGMVVEGISRNDLLQVPGVLRVIADSKRHILTTLRTSAQEDPPQQLSTASHQITIATAGSNNLTKIPWGLDRINQPSLPLDGSYTPFYTGTGVDVYVVDTGLDTNHIEFQAVSGVTREVKNIYDAYGPSQASMYHPGANTDVEGHGTHVAGTSSPQTHKLTE